jgi:hypothetical protein
MIISDFHGERRRIVMKRVPSSVVRGCGGITVELLKNFYEVKMVTPILFNYNA